jgi:hypothetical protein
MLNRVTGEAGKGAVKDAAGLLIAVEDRIVTGADPPALIKK